MSILSWYLKRISDEPVQYTSGVGASKAFFGGGGLGKINLDGIEISKYSSLPNSITGYY